MLSQNQLKIIRESNPSIAVLNLLNHIHEQERIIARYSEALNVLRTLDLEKEIEVALEKSFDEK